VAVQLSVPPLLPERGCMTFLPGTQHRTGLRPQDLHHEEDLFALDPSLRWIPRITVPLRAGDCTFHSGYTGHMALPNRTDLADAFLRPWIWTNTHADRL
jgi:phytanoyl-CoA hydroxylase